MGAPRAWGLHPPSNMTTVRSFFLLLSVLTLALGGSAHSASTCAGAVSAFADELSSGVRTAREFLAAHPELPAFLKQTPNGLVPVFLVNAETYATLRPLVVSSVGYGFEQRPGLADHGVLRVEMGRT